MKPAAFQPHRLDVAAFAKAQAVLDGQTPVRDLVRLSEGACPPVDAPADLVQWQARGSQREVLGGAPEVRLRLQAQAQVWLTCQRCLQPMALALRVDRSFRFMRDEDEAAELDEASEEEDVLALSHSLDLLSLVEDELIMALPIVPRHEACLAPVTALSAFGQAADSGQGGGAGPDEAAGAQSPFAVLKSLKLKPPTEDG